MGVQGLSTTEMNYITQKIQNERRSKRLTLKLQVVQGGVPGYPPQPEQPTQPRTRPQNNHQHPATGIRKVHTDWNLATARAPKKETETHSNSGGLSASIGGSGNPVNIEKEYMFYKDRCTKLEAVAKKARDILARNQKLEAEIELLNKGGGAGTMDKIKEIEKKYENEFKKKMRKSKD